MPASSDRPAVPPISARRFLQHISAKRAANILAVTLVLLAACQDGPTAADNSPVAVVQGSTPGALRLETSPAFNNGETLYGPVDVPVGNPARPNGYARLGVFPKDRYTLVYFRAAGENAMVATRDSIYPQAFTRGPRGSSRGSGGGCAWGLYVYSDSGGYNQSLLSSLACYGSGPVEAYQYVRGIVYGQQQGDAGWVCGPQGGQPCYNVSGGFTLTAWVPKAQLSLSAVRSGPDSMAVRAYDSFRFTVVVTPNQLGGLGVPRLVQSWRYVEDSTGATIDPSCGMQTLCDYYPRRSGRMRVTAWINSYMQTAEYPVRLGPIGLTLEPSRTSVAAGDSVTFTPRPTPADSSATEVLGWSWQPDSGTAAAVCATGARCTTAIARSGTMTVRARVQGTVRIATARVTTIPPTLTLEADYEEAAPGAQVTFTGRLLMSDSTVYTGPYTVAGWEWITSEPSVPVMSRLSKATGKVAGAGPTMSASSDSASSDSADVLERIEFLDHGTSQDYPVSPGTQPCQTLQLTCTTAVNQSGTMRLIVNVAGARLTAAAPVVAAFFCPNTWTGRTDPAQITATATRSVLVWTRKGVQEPVSWEEAFGLFGPWRAMSGGPSRRGGALFLAYRPSEIVRTFGQQFPGTEDYIASTDESSAMMSCWVYREKRKGEPATTKGYLRFENDFQAVFIKPPLR